jgi:hypothetical protein
MSNVSNSSSLPSKADTGKSSGGSLVNSIRRDFNTMTWVLIPVAIAINVVIGQIVLLLRLPLYLDSIGTVLVGMLCGPWAGALTGALSNIIWGLAIDPNALALVPGGSCHRPGGGFVRQVWPVQNLVEGADLGLPDCPGRGNCRHADRGLPVRRHYRQRFGLHHRVPAANRSRCRIGGFQHQLPDRAGRQDRHSHCWPLPLLKGLSTRFLARFPRPENVALGADRNRRTENCSLP